MLMASLTYLVCRCLFHRVKESNENLMTLAVLGSTWWAACSPRGCSCLLSKILVSLLPQ